MIKLSISKIKWGEKIETEYSVSKNSLPKKLDMLIFDYDKNNFEKRIKSSLENNCAYKVDSFNFKIIKELDSSDPISILFISQKVIKHSGEIIQRFVATRIVAEFSNIKNKIHFFAPQNNCFPKDIITEEDFWMCYLYDETNPKIIEYDEDLARRLEK